MTDHHLSDERLSAYIDGAEYEESSVAPAIDDVEDHLARCGTCADRLGSLREAITLVSAPVAPASAATKARVVAEALRAGTSTAGSEMSAAAPTQAGQAPDTPVAIESRRASRWYRRPQALVGAAAAVVALGVAIPLAVSSQSSTNSNPTAARGSSNSPKNAPKNAQQGVSPASPFAPGAVPSSGPGEAPGALGAQPAGGPASEPLPDLGTVGSAAQVVERLGLVAVPTYTSAQADTAYGLPVTSFLACVAGTRSAAHGGAHGPGLVATATYAGEQALVMEFWPTTSSPTAGQTVVAVSAKSGCKLLTRTTT